MHRKSKFLAFLRHAQVIDEISLIAEAPHPPEIAYLTALPNFWWD